jgi:phosphatidate cytidylyltransferase
VEVVLLTVGVSVIGDTLAYLVGSRFGRHPFFPKISPRKTWEGAVAALIAPTVTVGLLLPLALPRVGHPLAFGIGFLAALAAVIGDLVESQLKREVGVKDSGRLLPGHGGVLDRMDSLIFVGAVVYSLLGATHAF